MVTTVKAAAADFSHKVVKQSQLALIDLYEIRHSRECSQWNDLSLCCFLVHSQFMCFVFVLTCTKNELNELIFGNSHLLLQCSEFLLTFYEFVLVIGFFSLFMMKVQKLHFSLDCQAFKRNCFKLALWLNVNCTIAVYEFIIKSSWY